MWLKSLVGSLGFGCLGEDFIVIIYYGVALGFYSVVYTYYKFYVGVSYPFCLF